MRIRTALYFLFIILPLLTSCDYESSLVLENKTTTTIQLSVVGSPIQEYGAITLTNTINNKYSYDLPAQNEHPLVLLINQSLTVDKIPFDSLEIITNTDTLNFNSPDEIFKAMMERVNRYYTITIE